MIKPWVKINRDVPLFVNLDHMAYLIITKTEGVSEVAEGISEVNSSPARYEVRGCLAYNISAGGATGEIILFSSEELEPAIDHLYKLMAHKELKKK